MSSSSSSSSGGGASLPTRPRRRWLRRVLGSTAVVLAASGVALKVAADRDKGLERALTFWYNVMPMYIHYRVTDKYTQNWPQDKRDAEFEPLHEKYGPESLRIILLLRGFYIKLGQIGSTRADMMPKQYLKALATLQDQVPFEDVEYVRNVVETSLGKKLEEVFEEFDSVPLGSASIGQTHRAKLKNGQDVAVKVKYPFVEEVFDSDMETIENFCRLAQPEHVPFLKEIRKQFMTEFDYRREANSLQEVHDNLQCFSQVEVPVPVMDLCTRDVLVMKFLKGVKLVDAIKAHFRVIAESRGQTLEQLIEDHKEVTHTELEMDMAARWMWLRNVTANSGRAIYNWTAGFFTTPLEYTTTKQPVNIPRIMKLLLDVHAHEIFVDGMFNGDPHPGNILLLEDGRLGLIDYGQVKRLPLKERLLLAEIICALDDGDDARVIELHREMGFQTQKNVDEVCLKMAKIAFDRDDASVTGNRNLQQFVEHMAEVDPIETSADEFVMASRVSILLRGLGTHLSYPVATSRAWRPFADRLLQEKSA